MARYVPIRILIAASPVSFLLSGGRGFSAKPSIRFRIRIASCLGIFLKSFRTLAANSILYDAILFQLSQKGFETNGFLAPTLFDFLEIIKVFSQAGPQGIVDQIRHGLVRLGGLQSEGLVNGFIKIEGCFIHP